MLKKLYIVVISMTLLVITLATSTFAWVAIATSNRIDGISMKANLDSNLEFSLDGLTYKNEITTEQINSIIKDAKLMDFTSKDGLMFTSTPVPFVNADLNFDAVANKNYMSIELYVRTTSTRYTDLYLINNVSSNISYDNLPKSGTYVTSRGVNFRSPVTFQYGPSQTVLEGETRTYYAKDSIRVALIEVPMDGKDPIPKFIWDPSGNPERGYGKPYGGVDYIKQYHKLNFDLPNDSQDVINNLTSFTSLNAYKPDNENSKILSLHKTDIMDSDGRYYSVGKFRINIWIEGWDADAFDAVFNDQIMMQFEFMTALPFQNE
ncbi:hypothetical protein JN09_000649 [Acholeplasma morum]|uniref:hypothetical protein n=1 Tax=Paracholeplasma morum TaxID=264637 RepID=UPI0019571BF3|nr:hypothetical protein [Paracholeplasma morum]MBM7453324.1 hypothetical protein [Paracholeplasma morum]